MRAHASRARRDRSGDVSGMTNEYGDMSANLLIYPTSAFAFSTPSVNFVHVRTTA